MKVEATISRGEHVGEKLAPHKHRDGYYVVSKTRFERDYIKVYDLESVVNAVRSGLRLRMSAIQIKTAPGLIEPSSITIDGDPVDTI